jgi:hypothetical protein
MGPEVNLEGSLDAFSLPDVFQLLSLTKKSGGLHLTDGQVRGVVSFADGSVTGASADSDRQSLARRLVGIGVVDDAALRRAIERASNDRVGIARALVEAGAIDAETVRALAAEQTVDAVFDLLRWSEGDFAFALDEANPDDVGIALPADQVVAEATRRRQMWDSASKVIPSPDVVLVMPVVLPNDPTVTRDEWALLALVDGARTVGELVDLSGAGQFSVVSALAALVQRGMLAIRDEDAPDHVALVRRRQVALSALEAVAAPALAEPAPEPAAAATSVPHAPAAPAVAEPAAPVPAPAVAAATPPEAAAPAAEVAAPAAAPPVAVPPTPEPSPAPTPGLSRVGGAHVPQNVVPPRPEPIPSRRQPEYPDGGLVKDRPPVVQGAAVAKPAIERDPSVNRSLLLKLIAGVKGL